MINFKLFPIQAFGIWSLFTSLPQALHRLGTDLSFLYLYAYIFSHSYIHSMNYVIMNTIILYPIYILNLTFCCSIFICHKSLRTSFIKAALYFIERIGQTLVYHYFALDIQVIFNFKLLVCFFKTTMSIFMHLTLFMFSNLQYKS